MGASYSLRKQRREKLEQIVIDNKVQPETVLEDEIGENEEVVSKKTMSKKNSKSKKNNRGI